MYLPRWIETYTWWTCCVVRSREQITDGINSVRRREICASVNTNGRLFNERDDWARNSRGVQCVITEESPCARTPFILSANQGRRQVLIRCT